MTAEEKQFIQDHLNADVKKLLLNPPKAFKQNIRFLADQILARQKAKHKLPTWYCNFDLIFPPPLSVEQSSSEVTAAYKLALLQGKRLIDLSGGMGVDSMAFAQQFEEITYLDLNPKLCELIRHNSEMLGKKIQVVNESAEDFTAHESLAGCRVFVDPARRDVSARKVFRFSDCSPDLSDLLPKLRGNARQLLIKASPLVDISQGLEELGGASEVHIISVKNECKEVLFLLNFEQPLSMDPEIHAVNVGDEILRFKRSEENQETTSYGPHEKFLFIPNASILKSGAFKTVARKYGLTKLAANTHLYTALDVKENFPGRCFEVLDENPTLKNWSEPINVITRNHPLSTSQLRKKYGLKEGGDQYIIAFRGNDDKPQTVLARLKSPETS